jgi:hypothetical protein
VNSIGPSPHFCARVGERVDVVDAFQRV